MLAVIVVHERVNDCEVKQVMVVAVIGVGQLLTHLLTIRLVVEAILGPPRIDRLIDGGLMPR